MRHNSRQENSGDYFKCPVITTPPIPIALHYDALAAFVRI